MGELRALRRRAQVPMRGDGTCMRFAVLDSVDGPGSPTDAGNLIIGLARLPALITNLIIGIPYLAVFSIVEQVPLYWEAGKAYAAGRPDLAKQILDRTEWEKGEFLKSGITNLTQDVRTYWQPITSGFINFITGGGVKSNVSSNGWQGALFGNGNYDWALDTIGVPGYFQWGKQQIGRKLMSWLQID